MAITSPTSHFAPLIVAYLVLCTSPTISAINITAILSSFPELSSFSALISTAPSVASNLSSRTSFTLLAVPNSYLAASAEFTRHLSPSSLADLLCYHVLLQFLSWSDLHQIPPSGSLITTLFHTTGRASSNFGSVNITHNPSMNTITVHSPTAFSPSNATVLSLVKTLPYNITIFSINSLLIPCGFDLMTSETSPFLGLDIIKALIDGHDFNIVASMLSASGVVDELEADEVGAGITLFMPTDAAFSNLPSSVNLQSLPAETKAMVLRFHVLHSYYPLSSLESIVNPQQPTLATEAVGAGSYTLNISSVNGSMTINTGIVQGSVVTQTVSDQKPVAIFGVSQVLLPTEIFGKNPMVMTKPINIAQPREISSSSCLVHLLFYANILVIFLVINNKVEMSRKKSMAQNQNAEGSTIHTEDDDLTPGGLNNPGGVASPNGGVPVTALIGGVAAPNEGEPKTAPVELATLAYADGRIVAPLAGRVMVLIEKREKFTGKDFKRNYILNGLVDDLYNVYSNIPSAKELRDSLEKKYKIEDADTKKFVVAKFLDFHMVDDKSVVTQIEEFQIIVHDILAEGMLMCEPLQVVAVIEKLCNTPS
ncbi:fasciclin-like arabinogalactan protein 4 [Tripterygium wilfordii]|uniref:fasciclin-like arabinogalactan protein 4 n=1 Tax=Tripterygium wilfordii TaxID=458696 RepID=UPI0018F8588E|nr:fasciclin-like arabinogalactan protein 4 [Tripterygium wilfordii]